MAMNSATLKSAILSRLQAELKPLFENLPDSHELTGRDFDAVWGIISEIVAEEVVGHIQGFARCNGLDSNGDTHGNVEIV